MLTSQREEEIGRAILTTIRIDLNDDQLPSGGMIYRRPANLLRIELLHEREEKPAILRMKNACPEIEGQTTFSREQPKFD